MRLTSVLKIVAIATAVVSLASVLDAPGASARVHMRRPPDACFFHHRIAAGGTICSFDCNPNSLGCSQQICAHGRWYPAVPCLRPLCPRQCG